MLSVHNQKISKNISELANNCAQPKQDIFEGNTNEVFPIVDK